MIISAKLAIFLAIPIAIAIASYQATFKIFNVAIAS